MADHVGKLKVLAARENSVEIAGYGRESTHKGYLSWILDSTKNLGAPQFLKALCEAARGDDVPKYSLCHLEPPQECKCYWEQTLAKRAKVDLVVRASWAKSEYAVPIELKTDTGASSEKQFDRLSKPKFFRETPIADRLVLCLGSSSVQWLRTAKFMRLGPDEILGAETSCGPAGKQYFSDWLASVLAEKSRRLAALEAYKAVREKTVDHWALGYRSSAHLLYYVLDPLGRKLTKRIGDSCWSLYSGGYNTVLNLKIDGKWSRTRSIRGNLFFEFNDDSFLLKLRNGEWGEAVKGKGKKNDPEKLRKVLTSVREEVLENSPVDVPSADPIKGNRLDRTYLGVLRWRFDLTRQDEVVEAVAKIVDQCGPTGCLAPFVH